MDLTVLTRKCVSKLCAQSVLVAFLTYYMDLTILTGKCVYKLCAEPVLVEDLTAILI